jgi:hypothetical protein
MVTGAAALLLVGLAGAASATSAGTTSGGPNAVRPATAQASALVAGYYVTPSHAFASASATFVVPTVSCTSAPTEQLFGLLDFDPAAETGGLSEAVVVAECSGGTATYDYDPFESREGGPEPGINAGDTVEVSVFQTGNIEEAKVFDLTANRYYDAYDTPVPDTSMMIGEYSTTPTAKTSKISFTQVQVNGQYLSFEPSTEYNLLNGADTLIKTSAVPFNGDSFSLKFKKTS